MSIVAVLTIIFFQCYISTTTRQSTSLASSAQFSVLMHTGSFTLDRPHWIVHIGHLISVVYCPTETQERSARDLRALGKDEIDFEETGQ